MTTVVVTLILLAVPITLIVGLWRKKATSKVDWLVAAVLTAAAVGYVVVAGRWDTSSYYLRPLILVASGAALVSSFLRIRQASLWSAPEGALNRLAFGSSVVVAALFVGLLALGLSGLSPGGVEAVRLSSPLRDGVSYVGQGGASSMLNYHHGNRAQAYAVDVVGLNAAGRGSDGLAPSDPTAYVIFGRPVHSPCAGTVLEARNDLADQRPPATDRDNLAGNHVVIRCRDTQPAVDVTLAHLQQGSVAVARGAAVGDGQPIGRVGNTGNTSEPHLHVHAVLTGSGTPLRGLGVPILLDGRFWVRNDLIVAP